MLVISEQENRKQKKAPIKEQKKESKKPEKKIKKPPIIEYSSEEEENNDYTPVNGRMTRSMSNIQANIGRRSKAYEIMNMRPNSTNNSFAVEM